MQHQNREQELDSLFRSYRAASPDADPDPLFSTRLWEKIEARRSIAFSVRRWAQTLVTSAVVLCGLMAALVVSTPESSSDYPATYVEVLSEEQAPDVLAYVDFEALPED